MTDVPNTIADIKKKLRSKDTIDVLDTIEEKRSILLKRGKVGGTQSAPPGKSREKSGASNNQSLDEEDDDVRQPAQRMTRKSANPPVRKQQQPRSMQQLEDPQHWSQKLSPKQVHPNSYLQQKRDETRQQQSSGYSGSSAAGAGAGDSRKQQPQQQAASVTSQYTVSRNVDLSSALTASSMSPRRSQDNNSGYTAAGVGSSMDGGVYGGESKYSRNSVPAQSASSNSSSGVGAKGPPVDIQTTLAKLRKLEVDGTSSAAATSGSVKGGVAKNGRVEANLDSQFAKQAIKLGEYFSSAEAFMSKYKNLANDLE